MIYATQLPPTYIFENLNINESLYYSLFYRFHQSLPNQPSINPDTDNYFNPNHTALDATIQALAPHLSRVTLTTILRTLKSKKYIDPLYLLPLVDPTRLPNPPVTNKVITTKQGRPKTKPHT